ncbi:MAG: SDR family oxidoreductase, partial [Actinobacteria bacterium]|nr:SDR family oxidoreductase [Actinomycetota bacterium]MCG2788905.1 SDR family oxidoreductase [Actinomycetes bacterium]
MEELNLTGKVSVITGAVSGIGRAIAESFCAHGSDVAVVDKKDGKEAANNMREKYKKECVYFKCDVSIYDEVKVACKRILDKFSKVDILVCNVGYSSTVSISDMEIEEWQKTLNINLNGAFYFIHSLINPMIEKKKGNIIIIGSSTTLTGSGGGVHYAASKSGLKGIVKGISYELLSKGIRTNVITPAVIDTEPLRARYPDTEEVNKMLAVQIPLGRIG